MAKLTLEMSILNVILGLFVMGVYGRSKHDSIREGRTWDIAARRGSYKSLFLLNSGLLSLENKGNSVLSFGSLLNTL